MEAIMSRSSTLTQLNEVWIGATDCTVCLKQEIHFRSLTKIIDEKDEIVSVLGINYI
jgi:hypothetical protein